MDMRIAVRAWCARTLGTHLPDVLLHPARTRAGSARIMQAFS